MELTPLLGEATWRGPEGAAWTVDDVDGDVRIVRVLAERELRGIATGTFTDLAAGFRFAPPGAAGVRAVGFGLAEFGLPARSDGTLARWSPLLPHRPASVLPVLLLSPGGSGAVLLAPVEGVHEQCFPADEHGPAWGWHGDLDVVPAGFASSLAVVRGATPTECFERWGALVAGGAVALDRRYADALGSMPSYWTDNGASYWYRTEPGHDVPGGLAATVADLDERRIPVGVVQLDSWWYPHEVLRPFDTDEWVVPPTGLVRWEPRDDVLPGGLPSVGAHPLAAHCRHVSAASPYVEEGLAGDVDGDTGYALATPELYERWLDQCVAWGIETFEHDWLVEVFAGVRGVRAAAGRAAAWQSGVHAAAVARGRTLQWCMATPADLVHASRLPGVTSVRTSGDHGYLVGPGFLWGWLLLVGRLARSLGLVAYKDVFLTGGEHAELEALLSTLTAGPVGIGDRLGRARADVLAPCHRGDGRLVKPDATVAALDRCFGSSWPLGRRSVLAAGEASSTHAAGTWRYVVAFATGSEEGATGALSVDELGGGVLWDWRAGRFVDVDPDAGWALDLAPLGWACAVVPPPLAGGRVRLVGDPALHASAGDARIGEVHDDGPGAGVRVTVVGAPGEEIDLVARVDGETVRIPVQVPQRGWTTLTVS